MLKPSTQPIPERMGRPRLLGAGTEHPPSAFADAESRD